jgi:lysophospholipase L1-like esterase
MRNLAKIVAINALVLLVAIVLVELIFGAWVRDDSLNRLNLVRDRRLQFSTAHLYPSDTGVAVYTRDKYGLRGNFVDPSEITVLTIGGSTTDQRYVSDDSTWQSVLQRELVAAGKPVVIANAGVDGQSTAGHLKNFEWWFRGIPGLKPHYILFYVGINDFYRQTEIDYDDLVTNEDRRSLRQLLREYSALYHMAYTLYGVYQAEVKHKAGHGKVDFASLDWTQQSLRTDHAALMTAPLEAYRARLSKLVQQARAMGATPVLMTQPTHWYRVVGSAVQGVAEASEFAGVKINGVDRHIMMRMLDSATCEVAVHSGVPCVDLGAIESWKDSDFYDFTHMTPQGAEKLGKEMAQALVPIL